MSARDGDRRVSGAESARKMLSMLLCFSADRPTWSVPQLAEEVELSTSSAYRYVAVLREVGLLDTAGENTYRVTDRAVSLAGAAEAAKAPLIDTALPIMTRLRDQIDETVLVAQRTGTTVYCVDRVESRHPVRLQFDRGQPMPLHSGALARVLLAAMSERERDDYLRDVIPTVTPNQSRLLTSEALAEVSRTGAAESSGEVDAGIWGAASAIVVEKRVVAAIGTAAPDYRMDETRRTQVRQLVDFAASEVSQALSRR